MVNLINVALSKVRSVVDRLDRDKTMEGFQLAQGGLGNKAKSFGNQFVQAAAQTAPTVAQDFGNVFRRTTQNVPILSNVGQMVGDYGQRVGSGVVDLAQGGYRTAKSPTTLGKVQGAVQGIRGVGKLAVSRMPITPAVDILANTGKPDDLTRRLATGYSRGISQIDTLVPQTQAKPLAFGIDPAIMGGQMVGFVRNPINQKLFKLTETIFPDKIAILGKWLASTGVRGGIEQMILDLPELPTNISGAEKAQWMANTFGTGAVYEIGGRGILKGVGKAVDSRVGKATKAELIKGYDAFSEWKRKMNISVSMPGFGKKLGQTITAPMWKVKMGLVDDGSMQTYKSDIKTPNLKVESADPLLSEAKKYKSAEEFVKNNLPTEEISKTRGWLTQDGKSLDMNIGQHPLILKEAGLSGKNVDNFTNYGVIRLRNTVGANGSGQQNIQIGKVPTLEQINALKNLDPNVPVYYDININGKKLSSPMNGVSKDDFISQLTSLYNQAKQPNQKIDVYGKDYIEMAKSKLEERGNSVVSIKKSPTKIAPDRYTLEYNQAKGVEPTVPTTLGMDQSGQTRNLDQTTTPVETTHGNRRILRDIKTKVAKTEVETQQQLSLSQDPLYLLAGKKVVQNADQAREAIKAGTPAEYIEIETGKTGSGDSIMMPPPEESLKMTTIDDVEQVLYGSSTKKLTDIGGRKTGAGVIGDQLRKLDEGSSLLVERGLKSNSPIIRSLSRVMQGFMGELGKSRDQVFGREGYKGAQQYATKVAKDAQVAIYSLLKDNKSLERVHAVLDPSLAKEAVSEASLNGTEKKALGILRMMSDFINDTNYQNGFISKELWLKNRGGKYLTRAYEPFDYPPEIADFVKQNKLGLDYSPFKQRGDLTDWKQENAIRDPAYLVAKRLQQTMFNNELKRFSNHLAGTNMVSVRERPGFVQISDNKIYGELAGKWIKKDALEDIKGFSFNNEMVQKAYEVLTAYDRNPLRRGLKKMMTIFNPAVRLGNKTGNYVFAWMNGINPVTFASNQSWAKNAIKRNDPLYRTAVQLNLTGSDAMKIELSRMSQELKQGVTDPGILKKIDDLASESYGRVDDVAKLASFKTWLDRGYTTDEAFNKTLRGFQNYGMVGWLYDVGAKLPIFGNPFVRFGGELVRIAKNEMVDHPVRAIATVMAWKTFTDVMSRISGETPEDRKTREERLGASRIPFTNISLNVQTPWGEVNASRLIGLYAMNSIGESDAERLLPFTNDMGNDPIVGPVINILRDKDFRGKKISDPDETKYKPSTLTTGEKMTNRGKYLLRSYTPTAINAGVDIGAAAQGKENYYGQKRSVKQAIARAYPGVKVETFGPEEAKKQRERNAYFDNLKQKGIEKQIKDVKKQVLTGKLDQVTANKRIENLQKGVTTTQGKTYEYIDKNGSMQTIKLDFTLPTLTKTGDTTIDKKLTSTYNSALTSRQTDLTKLWEQGQLTQGEFMDEFYKIEKLKISTKKPKKITIKKVASAKLKTFTPKKMKITRVTRNKPLKKVKFRSKL